MNEISQKFKIWLGKYIKKDDSYKKNGINPKRDWNIILVFVFFALAIVAIISSYLYIQIKNGNLFTVIVNSKKESTKINQLLLNKTIEKINLKESIFNGSQKRSIVSDPSI